MVENTVDIQSAEKLSLTDLTNISSNDSEKIKLVPYVLAKAYNRPGTSAILNNILQRLKGAGINIDKNEIVSAARQMGIPVTQEYLRRINPDNSWINDTLNNAELATTTSSYGQTAKDALERGKEWAKTDGADMLNKAKEKSIDFFNTHIKPEEKEALLKYIKNLPRGRTKQATYDGPDLMGGRLNGVYKAPTR